MPSTGMAVLPQFQGSYYDLQRQQALAQALMQGALTPAQAPQAVSSGQYTVAPRMSPIAPLANVAQALMASRMGNQVGQGLNNLGAQQWQALVGGNPTSGFGASAPAQGGAASPLSSASADQPVADGTAGASGVSDQLGQGQQQGTPGMLSPGGPMNPLGMPVQQAAMMYMNSPDEYWKAQSQAFKPADIVSQIRAAGIDPSSPLGRQLAQTALAKANYIAPTSVRPGGALYDPTTGRMMTTPAAAPEGFQNVQDPQSGQWYAVPVQGGIGAVKSSAAANAIGKAYGSVTPAYNGTQPVFANAGALADQTAGGGTAVSPQAGAGAVNAGRFGGYQAPGSTLAPSLAPGVAGAADKVAGANADRYNQAVQFGVDSATRQNVLDNIIQLSQSGVQTGPGSDWQNNVKGLIANSPVLSKAFPSWKGSVSDYQELKKYLNQNGLRAWQAAGGTGTDTQMDAAMHANPNDTMFPQALQTMAAWAKAGELAGSARANFYQQFKNNNGGVSNLDQADQTWRNNFDPKIFQLETYSPGQRTALLNSLTPAQAKQLMQKRAWFKQNGLLQ